MRKYDEIIEYFKLAEYYFMNSDYKSTASNIDQAMTLCYEHAPKPNSNDRLLGSDFIKNDIQPFYDDENLSSIIKNKKISYKALPIAIYRAYSTGFNSGILPPYNSVKADIFSEFLNQYGNIIFILVGKNNTTKIHKKPLSHYINKQ